MINFVTERKNDDEINFLTYLLSTRDRVDFNSIQFNLIFSHTKVQNNKNTMYPVVKYE